MTEAMFRAEAAGACFAAHKKLSEVAGVLARLLVTEFADADLFRMSGTCLRIAAENALGTRDPVEAMRAWRECAIAEQQMRLATYRALRAGCIEKRTYDDVFRLAGEVARVRDGERLRLRWRLLQQA
jgi:hypothetical protein